MQPHSTADPGKSYTIVFIVLIPIVALVGITLMYFYLNPFYSGAVLDEDLLVISEVSAMPVYDSELGESASEGGWISIDLPYHWRNQFPGTEYVIYQVDIPGSQLEALLRAPASGTDDIFGVYLWRLNQTADIWFNDELVGSGGNHTEPMARHWNSPLYFPIPAALIQESNTLTIRHYALHSWGSMEVITVGADSLLRPIYQQRNFVQHDIALALFVFVMITGIFSLLVWSNRRQEEEYLWFALASAGLSFYSVNQFIRYLPFDADLWRWLSNVSTDLWAGALLIFMLHSLKLNSALIEKLVYIYWACGALVYFYASYFQVFDLNIYFHTGSLLLGIYAFYVCFTHYLQSRILLAAYYCAVISLLFIAGLHDTLMQAILNNGLLNSTPAEFQQHFNSVHFTAPVSFIVLAASLIKRFVDSMNEADRLNEELEERVVEARQELSDNYQAMEEVLVQQSAAEERERIFRDLHDDVGSKLLSLYYRLDNESDSTLAKSALEDLRDIVSHKSLGGSVLHEAIEQWRQEAAERLSDAHIQLNWQCDEIYEDIKLSELQHTQLRRMLREVFSNAILHNKQIREIAVAISYAHSMLSIAVSNDGATVPASQWRIGRGISNLRIRARDLAGEFKLSDLGDGWVCASWTVPIEPSGEST